METWISARLPLTTTAPASGSTGEFETWIAARLPVTVYVAADAGGGNVTINAAVGALTIAGQDAAALGGAVTVDASAGALTLTGQAAAISGVTAYNVDATNLFWSPGNWTFSGSTYAQTNNPGAHLKGRFDGTGAVVHVDGSMLTSDYGYVSWRIDGGAWANQLLTNSATQNITIATGLSDAEHDFEFVLQSMSMWGLDRWNTPTNLLRITGVTVTGVLVAPTLATERWIVLGDSITEGVNVTGTDYYPPTAQDARETWARQIGAANDAEVGIVGFVSQGWTTVGAGDVPIFHDPSTPFSWALNYAGQSRDFTGIDAIVVCVGANDAIDAASTATVEARVSDFLTEFRAAHPTIRVYIVQPFGGFSTYRTAIADGFADAAISDAYLIATSDANLEEDLDGDGTFPNGYTLDGLHPDQDGHDYIATLLDGEFVINVTVNAAAGALTIAGQTADVVPGAITVSADAGTLTIAGQSAGITAVLSDLTEGLVSYWSLDEASGTRVDSHGSNDLTDNNTVTSTTGKISTAADFEASNSEFLSHASNSDLQTGDIDFTFAVWVNLESTGGGGRTILSKFNNSTNVREYLLDYDATTSRFRFRVSSDGLDTNTIVADNLGAASLATWYYVVAWHDSVNDTLNIQVNDGTVDSVSYVEGVFAGNTDFRIGAAVASGGVPAHWDGQEDEVAFWKRILTDAERTDLWNGGDGRDYAYILSTAAEPDPITINAAVGTLTIAGQAAEVGDLPIAAAVGLLSLSGQAASVSALLTIYASDAIADGSGNSGLTTGDPVSLADAVDLCVPGTTVRLMDGTFELDAPLAITLQGTADAWITFQPDNPGGAVIEWTGVTNDHMFYLASATGEHCCFIEINGLIFDGANTATNGIFCQKPSGVTGFHPFAIRIINNEIRNTGSSGIASIQGDYIHVIGNKIHHVGMVRGWGSGIALNTNIWADNAPTFHNLILNNVISGIYDCCGSDRVDDPGDDTDITDGNGIIYDRSAAGNISPPVLVANNLVFMNGGRGIISYLAGNMWVINNTFYQNGLDLLLSNDGDIVPNVGDVQIGHTSENNYVFNNIVHAWTIRHAYALKADSDAMWRSNLWYGGDDLFGIDPGDAADPTQFINADPDFVDPPTVDPDDGGQYLFAIDPDDITNEFYLRSGSPAIDYGVDPRTVSGQKIILVDTSEVTDMTDIFAMMTEYLLLDAAGEPRDPGGDDWNLGAYEIVVVVDTVNANAGTLALAGQAATIVPGAVTVQAAAAELTLTSLDASAQIGAVTINAATATLTLAGQDATAIGGAVSVQVQAGALTLAGQSADVQPGAVSVLADAGALAITGNAATIGSDVPAVTINANVGVLTVTGQQIDIVPGAVVVTVVAATLLMVGRPATTTAGETRGDWTVTDAKAYEWTLTEAKAYIWTITDSSR